MIENISHPIPIKDKTQPNSIEIGVEHKAIRKGLWIKSNGKEVEITNAKIRKIADSLGIYLGRMYWFGRSKEGDYWSKEVGKNPKDIGKMFSHLRMNHFNHKKIFLFRRIYSYEKFGTSLSKAQKIVCFDIDGHRGEDTKLAVLFLLRLFPEDKFIEYNPYSKGYHVYIEFDLPVFDYALKNLKEFFLKSGHNIDPILSDMHMRFPFSKGYTFYGLFDNESTTLVQRFDIDSLIAFWDGYTEFSYFDPTFEALFPEENPAPRVLRKQKNSVNKKNLSLTQKLISNPSLDYGAGERHEKIIRILKYVMKYHLSLADFEEICDSHNKGSRGETGYSKLYSWGLSHFSNGIAATQRTDFSELIARIYHYSKITAIPDDISSSLEAAMDASLLDFLKTRKNLCPSGEFKNERLVRKRYGKHVSEFVLFLLQYLEAKRYELISMQHHSPDLILPLAFRHTENGIPLPLSFIKFLGKSFSCRSFPEIKVYLESIGMLSPLPLNEWGATYAEGRCIYYELSLK
jgi:hypothetical protein